MNENANYICVSDVARLYHLNRNSVYKIIAEENLDKYRLSILSKSFIKRDDFESLFRIK